MSAFNREAFEADGQWLINTYECTCGTSWADEWSCACDDDCPACGTTMTPVDSEDVTADYAE